MTMEHENAAIPTASSFEAALQETREISRRLLGRLEELNRQFPSSALEEAVRTMHVAGAAGQPRG